MADRPPVTSRRIPRNKLAVFLPNLELIKAFESLTVDVSGTLPDAIENISVDVDSVLKQASFSKQIIQPVQSTDDAQSVLTQAAFAPRHVQLVERPDSTQMILAAKIFGA